VAVQICHAVVPGVGILVEYLDAEALLQWTGGEKAWSAIENCPWVKTEYLAA